MRAYEESGESPLLRAVGLASAIMAHQKLEVWGHTPLEDTVLSQEQADLLQAYAEVLQFLRPKMVVFECSECHRWGLAGSSASVPRKCTLTFGCSAVVWKSRAAKKRT